MSEKVYQAFKRIIKNCRKAESIVIDGYSSFLFLNHEDLPKVAGNYKGMVKDLIKKYTKTHEDKLPNVTHTYFQTYILYQHGKQRNELEYLTVHHGTFQHNHDAWLLCTWFIRFCKG